MARLFFALWPPAAVREALAAVQARLLRRGVRAVPPANLHITLAFLGEVTEAAQAGLAALAAPVTAPAFDLCLDLSGWWPRTGIVWLAPENTPPALALLQVRLAEALAAAGFELEARAYRPHVTLARRARRAPRPVSFEPVPWPVRSWSLVQSSPDLTGSRYEPLACWNLTPSASG